MNFFKNIFQGNTLYYPGCMTKFALKKLCEKYKKILEIEEIDFITLSDLEFCCGSPIKNAGDKKEFERLAKENLKVFKDHGVTRIISNCPGCVLVFKKDYAEILGDKWDIKAFHFLEILNKSFKFLRKDLKNKKVTFHDPCHLGRGLGIYDLPRELILKTGADLKEMKLSKENSFCCGAGGGVRNNHSELSLRIVNDRLNQAREVDAEEVFTGCPMCIWHLEEGCAKNKEIKAYEIADLFDFSGKKVD